MNPRRPPARIAAAWTLAIGLSAGGQASAAWFIRGDLNASGGLNVTDAVLLLRSLFLGGQDAARCQDAADVNDDGTLGLADAVQLLGHLFLQGPRPGPNDLFPGCWFDGTQDPLDCRSFERCNPVGIFMSCDRSGTMTEGTKFQRLKTVMGDLLSGLSEADQVGIAFFDQSLVKFPATGEPVHATQETKSAAAAFVSSVQIGSGTCPMPALMAALQYAERSTSQRKIVVHISDGFATCPGRDPVSHSEEVLDSVAEANIRGTQINTITLGVSANPVWMARLAAENSGHHARIRE